MHKKEKILRKKQQKMYKDVVSVLQQSGIKSRDVKIESCDDGVFEIFFNGYSWGIYRDFKVKSIASFIKSLPTYSSWHSENGVYKRITCKLVKRKNKHKYKKIKENAIKMLVEYRGYNRAKIKSTELKTIDK